MAEMRDDELRARYRALATEEPPAALDDAIRAAARRAVSSAPGGVRKMPLQRWAVPASIAAVLFLSFGVVMRMEQEAPKVSDDLRGSGPPVFSQPPAAIAPPMEAEPARTEPQKPKATEAPKAMVREKKAAAPAPAPVARESVRESLAMAPASPAAITPPASIPVAPPAPAVAASGPGPAGAPAGNAADRALPAPASPPPPQPKAAEARRDEAAGSLGIASRAKVESFAAQSAPAPAAQPRVTANPNRAVLAPDIEPWPDTPERKLERIEALRRAGRDREADEAIARFRREHPDYRIPDDTWTRIKPR
jgi:hypothetical protein